MSVLRSARHADKGTMQTPGIATPQGTAAPDGDHGETAVAARLAAQIDRHAPVLDGIRGIAILAVMAFHYINGSHHLPVLKQVFDAAHSGWLGVDLFFVLSGFLITGILLKGRGRAGYYRNFYIRRTLRIFPLYYGVLAVVFGAGALIPALNTPGFRELAAKQGWLWTYTMNWAHFLRPGAVFNCEWIELYHFWSLAVEEQFYLVWPTVVLLLPRRWFVGLCVGIVGAAAAQRGLGAALGLEPWLFRADGLVLGGLIATLARSPDGRASLFSWSLRLGPASALIVLVVSLWRGGLHMSDPVMQGVGMTFVQFALGAGLVGALCLPQSSIVRAALSRGPLVAFGKYSYGIYVFHWMLNPLMIRYVTPYVPGEALASMYVVHAAALFVVKSAIAFAAAWLSYTLFESRFLKLKDVLAPG